MGAFFIIIPNQGCLGNGLEALGLNNLLGIFLILVISVGIALILLLFECFVK